MMRNPLILVFLTLALGLTGCGNRSIGNKIDDQFLEPRVLSAVMKANPDLALPTSRVVVTAYNGVILLAGQTPRAELRDRAEQAARLVVGVRKVHNELAVQSPVSALARSNDSLLTSRIKTSMLVANKLASSNIKVITENGIVYLMGIVSREQANRATEVAQNVSGVQRIVRLFQYTD
ncbi:MAG TPA: BON domain-containing protein [Pseudomonas sp.]|jgi:osmotically-inducible protein OsmY|nr:BON domain-containing protein [Pseudomonas sp.]